MKTNGQIKFLMVVLVAVIFVVSCSRGEETKTALRDACKILTKADAEEALGEKVTDPKTMNNSTGGEASVSNCLYSTDSAKEFKSASLLARVGFKSEKAEGALDRHIAGLKKQMGQDYKTEKVPGIGDGAIWDDSLNQLTVFLGKDMLIYSLSGTKADKRQEQTIALARKTLDRINAS